MNINTNRLRIRYIESKDLLDFFTYRSNSEVTKYQGFDVMTIVQAEDFIIDNCKSYIGEANGWVQYGIELIENKNLIGDCAIKFDQNDSTIAEIGITISHLEQRKGYGKEALLGIVNFLFETQKVHRIVATVDIENIASTNLLKSTGFKQEGHFVENVFFKGKWGSEFQYALLNTEL